MEDIYLKLGDRIKKCRKEKKQSQGKLAELLNVSLSTIAYYETGKRRIPMHHVQALEKILGRPLYRYQENNPVYETLEEKVIPFLNHIAVEAKYLPVTGYSSRKGFDPMDFTTRRMLPFPEQEVEEIDFIYGMGRKNNRRLYLISKSAEPQPGDLVLTEYILFDEDHDRNIISYAIESYDDIIKYQGQMKKAGIEDGEDNRIAGVVKGAFITGKLGKLTTVDYININV